VEFLETLRRIGITESGYVYNEVEALKYMVLSLSLDHAVLSSKFILCHKISSLRFQDPDSRA
jgi:hypothetical protein